jgi:hypothetical protein
MPWLPTPRPAVDKRAFPALRVLVPRVAVPSLKVTVPVAEEGVTVAVKVTDCPNVEGFRDDVMAIPLAR